MSSNNSILKRKILDENDISKENISDKKQKISITYDYRIVKYYQNYKNIGFSDDDRKKIIYKCTYDTTNNL
jgi:hypothetical protein